MAEELQKQEGEWHRRRSSGRVTWTICCDCGVELIPLAVTECLTEYLSECCMCVCVVYVCVMCVSVVVVMNAHISSCN